MSWIGTKWVRMTLFATLAALMTGCGSSGASKKEELSVALKSGRYQSAYDKAREVLANPTAHDEATVDYARQVIKESKEILGDHYAGIISVHIATGDIDRAIGLWSDLNARFPELIDTNMGLKLKLMRVYGARELWDLAKEKAEAVRSHGTNEGERAEAEEFLRNLEAFRRQESEVNELARRVADLETKTGVDLSGGATCGATNNEALTAEDRQLIIDLETARGELSTLRAALTRPAGSNLYTPVEDAEASNSQS